VFPTDEAISVSAVGRTDRPFADALRALKADRGLTYRELAAATRRADRRGKGISYAHISLLARGQADPTPGMLALVTAALDLPEGYFAEARLARARRGLDEREVGLNAALAELERIEQALDRPMPKRPGRNR
jgi:transcriptional regulator with XRE-family HTH domain